MYAKEIGWQIFYLFIYFLFSFSTVKTKNKWISKQKSIDHQANGPFTLSFGLFSIEDFAFQKKEEKKFNFNL